MSRTSVAGRRDVGRMLEAADAPALQHDHRWLVAHQQMRKLALHAGNKPLDLLLLGDSITENLLGTALGVPRDDKGIPAVVPTALSGMSTAVLGISGDLTQHVLWRLGPGDELGKYRPKVVNLMIGTNNVAHGYSAAETVQGIIAVASLLKAKLPNTIILLNKLLPRCDKDHKFTQAVVDVNLLLAEEVKEMVDVANLQVIDCNPMLKLGGAEWAGVNCAKKLMPDSLHPNAEGSRQWLQCIKQHYDVVDQSRTSVS